MYIKRKNENLWQLGEDEDLQSPKRVPRKIKADKDHQMEEEFNQVFNLKMQPVQPFSMRKKEEEEQDAGDMITIENQSDKKEIQDIGKHFNLCNHDHKRVRSPFKQSGEFLKQISSVLDVVDDDNYMQIDINKHFSSVIFEREKKLKTDVNLKKIGNISKNFKRSNTEIVNQRFSASPGRKRQEIGKPKLNILNKF